MALSKVEICNLALANIGIRRFISAITEDNPEAESCNLFYDHCRRMVLRSAEWGFATRRATLAEVTGTPPDEWSYQYGWPASCLKPLRIWDGLTVRRADQRIPFKLEYGTTEDERLLFCNEEDAVLIYTYDEENTDLFSPEFADALAWCLAWKIATPLSVDLRIWQMAQAMWISARQEAIAGTFSDDQEDPEPDSSIIAARD